MQNDRGYGVRRKQRARRGFWIIFCIGIIVVGLSVFILRQPLRRVAGILGFVRSEVGNSISETAGVVGMTKWGMQARIQELEARQSEYESRLAQMSVLQQENDSLRTILSYHAEGSVVRVAGVIGKPSLTISNRLILDQGSDHGVQIGDRVGIYGTIALGQVVSITATTAVVDLYSAPGQTHQGELRREGILLPVRGNGGGNFEIEVPRDVVVSDSDIITLADNPTHVLGVVKAVESDARDPFQTVLARTPVNIHELTYVELTR